MSVAYDIGEQNGTEYLVMEYVEGETLAALLKERRLSISEALLYGIQIADALRAAHARGIVHRDLKPANIMVTTAGIKVLDFGLAKVSDVLREGEGQPTQTQQTQPGEIVGTVAYMSPEQAKGLSVDARTDLFSAGALLYEMLCGQRPFSGSSPISTAAAILHGTPEPPHRIRREVTPDLERIV
jgi:serine/threonine protein kinase